MTTQTGKNNYSEDESLDPPVDGVSEDTAAEDAPIDGDGEEEEPPRSRRDVMLDQITNHRREELAENGVDLSDEEEGDDATTSASNSLDGNEDQSDDVGASAAEEVQQEKAPQKFTAEIDGKTVELTPEQIRNALRADEVNAEAQRRLAEATETLKAANTATSSRRSLEDDADEDADDLSSADSSDPLSGIDFESRVEQIQYGSREEAAEALRDIVRDVQSRTSTSMSADQIQQRVMAQLEWNQALETFGNEYGDILSDQPMAALAGNTANSLIAYEREQSAQTGRPMRPMIDIMRDAGNRTRAYAEDLAQKLGYVRAPANGGTRQDSSAGQPNANQNGSVTVSLSEARTQRKQNSPQPPSGRAQQASTPAPNSGQPVRRPNQSSLIAEVQASRRPKMAG